MKVNVFKLGMMIKNKRGEGIEFTDEETVPDFKFDYEGQNFRLFKGRDYFDTTTFTRFEDIGKIETGFLRLNTILKSLDVIVGENK